MFKFLFFSMLVLLLGAGGTWLYLEQNKVYTPPPMFRTYATYDPYLIETAERELRYSFQPSEFIAARAPYPTDQFDHELRRLVDIASERTPDTQALFEKEYEDIRDITVADNKTLYDYVGLVQKPLTYEIYKSLAHDLEIIVAQEKLRYDVARPMHVNLAINAPVATPSTPSYPSMFAARVTLVDVLLKALLPDAEYASISPRLKTAIDRAHVFGISTKFDTEYGSELAEVYTEHMISNVLSKEFIQAVKEREWSNTSTWQPGVDYNSELSDIVLSNPRVQKEGAVYVFKTDITNQGVEISPETMDIVLEIDQFADGTVDQSIKILYGQIEVGNSREAGYILSFSRPGTHRFRFVANPDYTFIETQHQNNYGEWVTFTIE